MTHDDLILTLREDRRYCSYIDRAKVISEAADRLDQYRDALRFIQNNIEYSRAVLDKIEEVLR